MFARGIATFILIHVLWLTPVSAAENPLDPACPTGVRALIHRFFGGRSTELARLGLDDAARAELSAYFGSKDAIPRLDAAFGDPDLFWHSFSRLPKPLQEIVVRAPSDPRGIAEFFSSLSRSVGTGSGSVRGRSFLDNIERAWMIRASASPGTAGWGRYVQANLAELEAKTQSDPAFGGALAENFRRRVQIAEVTRYWEGAFRIPIPSRKLSAHEVELQIGSRKHIGRIVSGGTQKIEIRVPRSMVKIPAWNPLDTRKLVQLSKNGVVKRGAYDAELGHDGNFYLMDGNHRFSLSSDPEIPLKLTIPVSTVSLRGFFDLRNIRQPTLDQQLRLMNGEIGPRDLADHASSRNWILLPD